MYRVVRTCLDGTVFLPSITTEVVTAPNLRQTTEDDAADRLQWFGRELGTNGSRNDVLGWFERDGPLESFDDIALAEWWSRTCWVRRLVWSAAAQGHESAVDLLAWLITRAHAGDRPAFASLLARDLLDVARVVNRTRCGTSAVYRSVARSTVPIFRWLRQLGVKPAFCAGAGRRAPGGGRLTGGWSDGLAIDAGALHAAATFAALAGNRTLVIELSHQYRPLVVFPVTVDDQDEGSSDVGDVWASHLWCVDLVRRRGGWLSERDVWMWDRESAPAVPPIGVATTGSPFDVR